MKKSWISYADIEKLKHNDEYKIYIIQSLWNYEITEELRKRCVAALEELGSSSANIVCISVPGTFEIPQAAKMIASEKNPDAIISLGCVIKGRTDHDAIINNAVANGLMQLSVMSSKPCIFGVLTTNTEQQALERSNGAVEDKGRECGLTAISMIKMKEAIQEEKSNIGFYR